MILSTMTEPCEMDISLHPSDKQVVAWEGQCLTHVCLSKGRVASELT